MEWMPGYDRCFACNKRAFAVFSCQYKCQRQHLTRYYVCWTCSKNGRCLCCGGLGGHLAGDSDLESWESTDDELSYRDEFDDDGCDDDDDDDDDDDTSRPSDLQSDDHYNRDVKCYMPDTEFELEDGSRIKAQDLQPGMKVCAPTLHFRSKFTSHSAIDTAGVLLTGHSFQSPVSVELRVVVPCAPHSRQQAIPASHLRAGERVCCESGIMALTEAEPLLLDDGRKFEVTFAPDVPVPTFWVGKD